MGLVPEDRASARSDEPEARSDARWRERAVLGTPPRHRRAVARAGPVPARRPAGLGCSRISGARRGRSHAYARSLVDYLGYCERAGVDVVSAGRAEIAGYLA